MIATQRCSKPPSQRKVAHVPVSDRAVMDFTRILTCAGASHEWQGTQPEEIANVRDNCARGITKTGRNAFLCLLWNGLAQRIADFVDAQRRAALGQSRVADIPQLRLAETAVQSREDYLEMKQATDGLTIPEARELGELLREHARVAIDYANAMADQVNGGQAA